MVNKVDFSRLSLMLINFAVPPMVVPFSFQDGHLLEGMLVRVSCVVSRGDLPLTITWLKDGQPIPAKLSVTIRDFDEYSSVLSIDPLTVHHNGNYTCMAHNEAASASYTAQLSVNVPPRWRVEPQDTSVAKGEGVTIPCDADGFPKPTTQWMKVQGNDPSGKKVAVLSTSFVHILNNGSLRITHASEDHSGYYFCIATNGVGHDLGKVMHLAVLAPPSVLRKHSVAPAVKGETVQIACEVTGNFPIKVTWQVHETVINPGSNHRYHTVEEENMEKTLLRSELTISEVDKKDSTMYKCIAENSHGKDEGEVQLLVMEPPEAPQELRVSPAGNRTVEISWKTPFDGNSRISQYVVQYKRDADKWKGQTQEVSVHGSDTHARIDRLYPATTYNFRIRAENDVGVGDASEVISFTTEEEAPDGPPETVEVEPTDASSLRVSWKPPDVNHRNGGIRGYNIGHKIHGLSDPYTFTNLEVPEDYTEDLIYQLTNLNMYTQYSIVVQAYNKGGKGPLSEEVVVLTSEDVPSEPPKEVRCSSLSSRSIYVIWEPPSTQSVNGILRGYKVLFKPINIISDILSQSKVAHVPKITLTELEVSTNYTIQVLAFTKMGDGIRSEPVFCKTHEDVPGSPDDIKVLPTSVDSVLVSWKPPAQRNGLVNKYNVYVRGIEDDGQEIQYSKDFAHNGDDNFDDIRTSEANNLFYEITGLRKNRRYEFWVTALSSIGEGPSSKVIIETPKGPTVAAKASSFDDVIKTPWKKDVVMPCRAVGTPPPHKKWLFGYEPVKESKRVQLRPDGSLQITGIQKEDSGNYTCKVLNQHGKDDVTYCVIVQIPPGAPVLDVISKSLTSIQLQWRKGETGGDDVRGYVLHYKKDRGQWEKKELAGNLEAYHLDRLACGATYQLYMESFNTIGIGAPCDILTVATKDEEMTVPPKDDLIREGATFVTVQLDAWPSNGCPVLHFTAEYRKQSSKDWILVGKNLKPTQKKVVIPNLTPATWYILRLTAYTSSGPSSTEYNFSTHTAVGGTLSPDVIRKEEEKLVLFYIDPLIFVPIAAILAVIVVTIAVACFCCRSQHSSATKHPKNIKEWVRSSTPGASRGHRTPVHSYVHAHQKGERVTGSFSSLQGRAEDPVPYATSQLTTGISDQGFETGSSCSGTLNNEAFWKDKKGALELPVRPASDVFAQGGVAAQMWLAAHNNALVRRSMFPGAAPVSAGSRSGSTTSLIQQETGFSPGMQVRSRSGLVSPGRGTNVPSHAECDGEEWILNSSSHHPLQFSGGSHIKGSLQGPGVSAKDSHAPERKSGPK